MAGASKCAQAQQAAGGPLALRAALLAAPMRHEPRKLRAPGAMRLTHAVGACQEPALVALSKAALLLAAEPAVGRRVGAELGHRGDRSLRLLAELARRHRRAWRPGDEVAAAGRGDDGVHACAGGAAAGALKPGRRDPRCCASAAAPAAGLHQPRPPAPCSVPPSPSRRRPCPPSSHACHMITCRMSANSSCPPA